MTGGKCYDSGIILSKEQRRVLISNALVQDLLNVKFETKKKKEGREEVVIDRAYFCLKCRGKSLTKSEVAEFHNGHRILRAMKCSGSYGYVNKEIAPILQDIIHDIDLSEIYGFKINVYNIYFPKSRKKNDDKSIKMINNGRCCVKCMHTLPAEGYSFCSIECRITCTNDDLQRHHDWKNQLIQDQNQVTLLPWKKMKRTAAAGNNNKNTKKRKIDLEGLATIAIHEEADGKKLSNVFGYSYRKRSRKGTPCRAPLF